MSKFTNAAAAKLAKSLDAAKLDKHGKRLQSSLAAMVDGGDRSTFATLAQSIHTFLEKGAPVETKSTRRRATVELPAADKAAITEEAKARGKATGKAALQAITNVLNGASVEVEAGKVIAMTTPRKSADAMGGKGAAKKARTVATETAARRNPDVIVSVKSTEPASESRHVAVSTATDSLIVPKSKLLGDVVKLAVVGGSLKAVREALEAAKPAAALAKGVDGHNSPHAAKAVSDNRAKLRKAATDAATSTIKGLAAAKAHLGGKAAAPVKAKVETKKAERKVERAAKAAPKSSDTRTITVLDKAFTFGAVGTSRRASWDAVRSGITVADYAKAGGALKYIARWVSAGAIKLA